jgi:hypothetical protein
MLATFAGLYLLAGIGQFESTGGTQNTYWAEWFPPGEPVALVGWLAKAHTGNMLAHPFGGPNGGSVLTTLLCVLGCWQLARTQRRALLVLLGMPFLLTFSAAALHRYPYGGSARIALHLAPAICLLAGAGLGWLLTRWLPSPQGQRRAAFVSCVVLALCAGGTIVVRDLLRPFKTEGDHTGRQIVHEVFARAGQEDQIVVLQDAPQIWPTFEWYLRQRPERVAWKGRIDEERLARGGDLWVLSFTNDAEQQSVLEARLARLPRRLIVTKHESHTMQVGQIEETIVHCEVFHLAGR